MCVDSQAAAAGEHAAGEPAAGEPAAPHVESFTADYFYLAQLRWRPERGAEVRAAA